MQARYYDPVIGRFYSNDPVSSVSHLNTQNGIHGFNSYAYANNNPYKFIDPDGKESVGMRLDIRTNELLSEKISPDKFRAENKAEAKGGYEAFKIVSGPIGRGIQGIEMIYSTLDGDLPISEISAMIASDTAGNTVNGISEDILKGSSKNKFIKAANFISSQASGLVAGGLSNSTDQALNDLHDKNSKSETNTEKETSFKGTGGVQTGTRIRD